MDGASKLGMSRSIMIFTTFWISRAEGDGWKHLFSWIPRCFRTFPRYLKVDFCQSLDLFSQKQPVIHVSTAMGKNTYDETRKNLLENENNKSLSNLRDDIEMYYATWSSDLDIDERKFRQLATISLDSVQRMVRRRFIILCDRKGEYLLKVDISTNGTRFDFGRRILTKILLSKT